MTHQKQELLMAAIILADWDKLSNLYGGHSIHAAYLVSFIWWSGFRREGLCRNRPIRNKNYLWLPCL
jgi:hypothetical protein